MQAIFSIKLWILFIWKMFDAIFPTVVILLALSWKGLKRVKGTPEFRMFLIFLAVISAARFFIFFSGLPYQGRYLYPIVIALIPLSALGLNELIMFMGNLRQTRNISPSKIAVAVIVAIVAINVGKALYFTPDKQWIKDVSAFVKKSGDKSGKVPVLISGVDDMRLAYYSESEFLKLTFHPEIHYIPLEKYPKAQILEMATGGDASLLWLPYYNVHTAGELAAKIKRIDAPRVFLFLDEKDRDLLNLFVTEKVDFPFKQVAVFKEGRKKTFILYERADR